MRRAALWLTLTVSSFAHAGRYTPGFDRAVAEATWILELEVVSTHGDREVLDLPAPHFGLAHEARVVRSFRGPFHAGDELWVWDPDGRSTSGYDLDLEGHNLTFLAPPGAHHLRGPAVTAPALDGRPVGVVFRNVGSRSDTGGLQGWVELLERTEVGHVALSDETLRSLVRSSSDPDVLCYALGHYPRKGRPGDEAAVVGVLQAHLDEPLVTRAASDLLRARGAVLESAVLRRALLEARPRARRALVQHVDVANVEQVQDVLWSWLAADEEGAQYAITALAEHAPEWTRTQVERHALPFWLDIPILHALSVAPVDVGRSYPVTAPDVWSLSGPAELVRGTRVPSFGLPAGYGNWAETIPLVVPHLPELEPRAREVAIAMLGTHGWAYERVGDGVELGPRGEPPVRVEITGLRDGALHWREAATRAVRLCPAQVGAVDVGRSGAIGAVAWVPEPPPLCPVLEAGATLSGSTDVRELVEESGAGSIELVLVHTGGGATQRDAWSGAVHAPPVEARW